MERWACWAVTLLPGARRSAATRRGGPGRGSGADHPGNHGKPVENPGKPRKTHG